MTEGDAGTERSKHVDGLHHHGENTERGGVRQVGRKGLQLDPMDSSVKVAVGWSYHADEDGQKAEASIVSNVQQPKTSRTANGHPGRIPIRGGSSASTRKTETTGGRL